MALTIFIKFCGFIVHSKPNNMSLSAFPEINSEARKNFLIFFQSPKPTDQSRSNPKCRVLLQIFLGGFFLFRPTLKIKDSWFKEQFKNLIFTKMTLTIFIKFCVFIEHFKPNSLTLSNVIGKFPEGKKIIIISLFCLRYNTDHRKYFCNLKSIWDHKLLIKESYIEISSVVLEL